LQHYPTFLYFSTNLIHIFNLKRLKESWKQKIKENDMASFMVEDFGSVHPQATNGGFVVGDVEAPQHCTIGAIYSRQELCAHKTQNIAKYGWVAIKST
jgi:hypothetical protein